MCQPPRFSRASHRPMTRGDLSGSKNRRTDGASFRAGKNGRRSMQGRTLKVIAVAAAAALALASCGKGGGTQGGGAGGQISGAGATFPAPLYAKWAQTYRTQTNVAVNYQGIGSGGGIKQIEAKTVDFGASDKPLKPVDLTAAGLMQFPTVIGGVVPVMNLPGIAPGQVKLTGQLLGDIYMGAVKVWNDPKIAALNPGVNLPSLPITVVHRSDGSGTSFIFTSYLSAKNAAWATRV